MTTPNAHCAHYHGLLFIAMNINLFIIFFPERLFQETKKSNDGCQILNWKPYYSTYLLGLLITREFATTYIHSVLTTILSVITLLNLTMTVNCEATTATKNVVQTEQTAK